MNGDDAAAAIAVALEAEELLLVADVAGVIVDGVIAASLSAEEAVHAIDERHGDGRDGDEAAGGARRARSAACRRCASPTSRRSLDPALGTTLLRSAAARMTSLPVVMAETPSSERDRDTPALLPVYKRAPIEIVRGEGVQLFDADGRAISTS